METELANLRKAHAELQCRYDVALWTVDTHFPLMWLSPPASPTSSGTPSSAYSQSSPTLESAAFPRSPTTARSHVPPPLEEQQGASEGSVFPTPEGAPMAAGSSWVPPPSKSPAPMGPANTVNCADRACAHASPSETHRAVAFWRARFEAARQKLDTVGRGPARDVDELRGKCHALVRENEHLSCRYSVLRQRCVEAEIRTVDADEARAILEEKISQLKKEWRECKCIWENLQKDRGSFVETLALRLGNPSN